MNNKPYTEKEEIFSDLWEEGNNKESIMEIMNISNDEYEKLKTEYIENYLM